MDINYKKFKVIVREGYESICAVVAEIIAGQIATQPDSVLGLATGSTPLGVYKKLVGTDFSRVTCFNLDEYHPIERTNHQSYHYFMMQNLFNRVNINPDNINIPSGEAVDFAAECDAYEEKIAASGGIDLQLLGIGPCGHVGFNEPAAIFPKQTHYVALDSSTIEANSRFFESTDKVPKHAITMGVGTIFSARHILLMATGSHKADIVEKVVLGDIDPQVSGSILQLHPNVTLAMDAAAAVKLLQSL